MENMKLGLIGVYMCVFDSNFDRRMVCSYHGAVCVPDLVVYLFQGEFGIGIPGRTEGGEGMVNIIT